MLDNLKRKIKSDALLKGSLILFIMLGVYNFLNYVFHFSMGRLLGPEGYGVLAVIMSLVYIFSIPSEAVQTIISKYTSKFNAKKQTGKIRDLFSRVLKKLLLISVGLLVAYVPFAFLISWFLKIEFWLVMFTGIFIFYAFMLPLVRGILQGRKQFKQFGMNMMLESFLKVIFAILFVLIGFKVYGAILAIVIAGVIVFFNAISLFKDIFKTDGEKAELEDGYGYGLPILIAMTAIVLFYSLDIIIAKRVFSAEIAGMYAVASMLGKMIFFGTQAVSKAMFPLTTENHSKGKNTRKDFKNSVKIVGFLCACALIVFLFFPKLIISILYGKAYLEVASILFIIGLSYALISFSNLIIVYGISTDRIKKSSAMLLVFVAIQIALMLAFNSSILEFSLVFLTSSILMFLYCLILVKLWKN